MSIIKVLALEHLECQKLKLIGGLPMLKPLGDRIVLRVKKEEEKSIGGIVLATNAQEKPSTAEVVAVGEGKRTHRGDLLAPSVAIGDLVVFEKFAGTEIKDGGDEFLIVREGDILAIVD
jgi:chaperonin GroES